MPKTHTVAQGETLNRIAKKYDFVSWETLYNHPDNTKFKSLRPDPNVIYPGDRLTIPDKEKKVKTGSTGSTHTFTLKKPEQEKFRLKVQSRAGKALQGKKIVLEIEGETIDVSASDDGSLEAELPKGNESAGELKIYMDPKSEEPTHVFEIQLGHLDPVEELSGVQARCNLLGFDCGVADGVMGSKTRAGVEAFQTAHQLQVDGEPGPITQGKLKEIYGC